MLHYDQLRNNSFRNVFIVCLLLGSAIRIPLSTSVTVSSSDVFLALSIVLFPFIIGKGSINFTKMEIKLLLSVFFILSFLTIQFIVNTENFLSVLLIFEHLFIGILLFFIFNRIGFNHSIYFKSLVFLSLYLSINTIYFNVIFYEEGAIKSVLSFGSGNYTSAIMLIILPIIILYIRGGIERKINSLGYISIFLMLISIVFSGSRSNIVVLAIQFITYIFLVRNSFSQRIKIIISTVIISISGFYIVRLINPELLFIIERYLLFFTDNSSSRNDIASSDDIRQQLITEATLLINENKFWGIGFARLPNTDIPIHNFMYEIILSIGYIGFAFYIIYFTVFVLINYFKVSKFDSARLLYLLMITSFLLISWVHPFMTTGKEFTLIFWLSLIAFSFYRKKSLL